MLAVEALQLLPLEFGWPGHTRCAHSLGEGGRLQGSRALQMGQKHRVRSGSTGLAELEVLQGTRTRCLAAEQRCQELQSSLRKRDSESAELQAQLQVRDGIHFQPSYTLASSETRA